MSQSEIRPTGNLILNILMYTVDSSYFVHIPQSSSTLASGHQLPRYGWSLPPLPRRDEAWRQSSKTSRNAVPILKGHLTKRVLQWIEQILEILIFCSFIYKMYLWNTYSIVKHVEALLASSMHIETLDRPNDEIECPSWPPGKVLLEICTHHGQNILRTRARAMRTIALGNIWKHLQGVKLTWSNPSI